MANDLLRQLAGFSVQHGYALLPCMQIAPYNFHLRLLRPEPFLVGLPQKSTRVVVRPVLMSSDTGVYAQNPSMSAIRIYHQLPAVRCNIGWMEGGEYR